ncbi:hypothetical protein BU24DRAFT_6721 [Aaosphaeria arxii CBS 175.79]|uniref:Uncharacterized protein n=1 Tax=Aaosphaeria arxii CBS 175.79 TaxID=1450172 RepID=A0A6A5Y7G7_9PLEO|nr:uncharacterized protein BU24DRAFT_6721 [Aaosphaeria arxii CBS 175.79]KAF2020691.1 hypothetical protein BU24DRAFT_6721 [Aaosphaeria arxii CBS 175.79]
MYFCIFFVRTYTKWKKLQRFSRKRGLECSESSDHDETQPRKSHVPQCHDRTPYPTADQHLRISQLPKSNQQNNEFITTNSSSRNPACPSQQSKIFFGIEQKFAAPSLPSLPSNAHYFPRSPKFIPPPTERPPLPLHFPTPPDCLLPPLPLPLPFAPATSGS